MVESTGCAYRGPRFGPQHARGVSQPFVTTVPGSYLMPPFLSLEILDGHEVLRHTQAEHPCTENTASELWLSWNLLCRTDLSANSDSGLCLPIIGIKILVFYVSKTV